MKLKRHDDLTNMPSQRLQKRGSWRHVFALAALIVTTLMSMSFMAANVYADGGVGSGGNGGPGCRSSGHYTCFGWGWGVYQRAGSGPTSHFNDAGTTWASVQATCANESEVYVFIIDDQNGNGMGYNYKSSEEGPPQYSGRFPYPGTASIDHGLADSVSTDDAFKAYNTATTDHRYGVSTNGHNWGDNVGWFCYGYTVGSPNPQSNDVTISGTVYYYNGSGSIGLAGVPIDTCQPPNPQTGGNNSGNAQDSSPVGGTFSFSLPAASGAASEFCIRAPARYPAPDGTIYTNPVITPNALTPGAGANCSGNTTTYEFQNANNPRSATGGPNGCDYGLPDNGNYNIAYTKIEKGRPQALPCAGQNTQPTVTLPNASAPNKGSIQAGSATPTGATTTPGQEYYKELPGDLKILDAFDQYGAPTYSGPTHLTDNGSVGWDSKSWQSSHDFTLYYDQYITQYPYDDHQTTVTYQQKYTETHYHTSTSPDYYTCGGDSGPMAPSDGNGHPATCRHDYTGYVTSYSCNPGDPGGGLSSTCTHYYSNTSTYTGTCGGTFDGTTCVWWNCNPGDSGGGSDPSCSHTDSGSYQYNGSVSGYGCYGNNGGGGASSDCYYTYTGTAWYNWNSDSPGETISQGDPYVVSQVLNECFNRNFTVQQPTDTNSTDVTQVTLLNDYENPTSATIGTQTSVRFNLYDGPVTSLRHGMGVNGLAYIGTYYIEKADGSAPIPLVANGGNSSSENVGGTVMTDGLTATTTYTPTIAVSLPPLAVGDKVCAQFTIIPGTGQVDENGTQQPGVSGSVNSSRIPTKNTCSAPVTNEPYTRFYGNDVQAGAVFAGGSCNSSAGISTFNGGSGARTTGSGSQYAAMSLGTISNFASAFLRNAAPTSNTGLTFANTTGGYGGQFGGPCTTLPDYYGAELPANSVNRDINAFGSFPIPSGSTAYTSPRGGTLSGGTLPTGSTVSIFVNGDVYISNNILFDQSGWTFNPTDRTTTVPSFYLIVKGNINIAPNVTQLDGVYIAQPNGASGGTIRTCSQRNGSPYATNSNDPSIDFFTQCNNQLTVNGSFIAKDIKFDRTFSKLRQSIAGETPLNGGPAAHGCNPNGLPLTIDCSAEIFNFSPESYIGMPALQPTSSAKKNTYDFITSLSPVL